MNESDVRTYAEGKRSGDVRSLAMGHPDVVGFGYGPRERNGLFF